MNLAEPTSPQTLRQLSSSISRIGYRRPADQAFNNHQSLQEITLRLVEFLTDRPTSPFCQRPIIDTCIESALQAYFHVGADSPEPSPLKYVQTLVTRATDALSVDAYYQGERWFPDSGESLGQWLARFPDAQINQRPIEEHRITPSNFRRMLAQRLLDGDVAVQLNLTMQDAATPPD